MPQPEEDIPIALPHPDETPRKGAHSTNDLPVSLKKTSSNVAGLRLNPSTDFTSPLANS